MIHHTRTRWLAAHKNKVCDPYNEDPIRNTRWEIPTQAYTSCTLVHMIQFTFMCAQVRLAFPKSPLHFCKKSRPLDSPFMDKFGSLSVVRARERVSTTSRVDKTSESTAHDSNIRNHWRFRVRERIRTKSQCYEFRIRSMLIFVIQISNGIRSIDNLKDKRWEISCCSIREK